MKPAESIDELKGQMKHMMASALNNEGSRLVKSKLQQSATDRASGPFSRSGGGVSDIAMFKSTISTNKDAAELSVVSTAEPQPSIFGTPINSYEGMFAEWIEYGEWMDISHFMKTRQKVKRSARPFFQPVEEDLGSSGEIEAIIAKYLE